MLPGRLENELKKLQILASLGCLLEEIFVGAIDDALLEGDDIVLSFPLGAHEAVFLDQDSLKDEPAENPQVAVVAEKELLEHRRNITLEVVLGGGFLQCRLDFVVRQSAIVYYVGTCGPLQLSDRPSIIDRFRYLHGASLSMLQVGTPGHSLSLGILLASYHPGGQRSGSAAAHSAVRCNRLLGLACSRSLKKRGKQIPSADLATLRVSRRVRLRIIGPLLATLCVPDGLDPIACCGNRRDLPPLLVPQNLICHVTSPFHSHRIFVQVST